MKSLRKTAVLGLFGLIALLAFPLTATASSTFQAVNAGNFDPEGATPASAGTLVRKSGEARGRAQHGTANMTAELDVGPMSTGNAFFGALMDSFRDEIHIVIETHGDSEVGLVADQISIAGAGCNPACIDQQFVVFPPMMP
jgi:hypothetical protein